jgi:Protein of unknown function (DUF2442)
MPTIIRQNGFRIVIYPNVMDNHISGELQVEIDSARVGGKEMQETEPKAVKAWYAADTDRIFIELNTEIIMGFPSLMLQGLSQATPKQLAEVEVTTSGYGLHWESLDVDLAVPQLVAGLFGTKAWMAELGRQGGKSRSSAKAQASRDNGKLGGRPCKPLSSESKSDELLNREG